MKHQILPDAPTPPSIVSESANAETQSTETLDSPVILHLHRVHQTAVYISQQAQSDVIQPGSHKAFRLWNLIFEDFELYYRQ